MINYSSGNIPLLIAIRLKEHKIYYTNSENFEKEKFHFCIEL